jgi:hypothetical protein
MPQGSYDAAGLVLSQVKKYINTPGFFPLDVFISFQVPPLAPAALVQHSRVDQPFFRDSPPL